MDSSKYVSPHSISFSYPENEFEVSEYSLAT